MNIKHIYRPLAVLSLAASFAAAQAFTFATFADPTLGDPTPDPMFFVSPSSGNGTIAGGWSGTGLVLQTWMGDYSDVTFTMASTATTEVAAGFYDIGAGSVVFETAGDSNLLTITFDSGFLSPNGVGGSDFVGNNVTFSGTVAAGGFSNEAFAFTFANPNDTGNAITYTASFTSSAVPEPTSFAVLGLAGLAALRRRKS